jgi:hypothetical protein
MEDMLSIEKDAHVKDSFEFNKPYNCIRLDCRPAAEVLPGLNWNARSIVWLDYDGRLDEEVLSDIATVIARAQSGSVLVVSVNAHVERDPDEAIRAQYAAETGLPFDLDAFRLRELARRVGDALPTELLGKELRGKGLAKISHKLIHSRIEESLAARNAMVAASNRMRYQQIFNFLYSDGALMLTTGGVIVSPDEESKFQACAFSELGFVRSSEEPYHIQVPCLGTL